MRTGDLRSKLTALPSIDVDDQALIVNISTDGAQRVVQICGELDLATRNLVLQACAIDGDNAAVVIEMAEMTFMDCNGYSSLVAARHALEQHGGSLTLRNQAGQPARLLVLLSLPEAG